MFDAVESNQNAFKCTLTMFRIASFHPINHGDQMFFYQF